MIARRSSSPWLKRSRASTLRHLLLRGTPDLTRPRVPGRENAERRPRTDASFPQHLKRLPKFLKHLDRIEAFQRGKVWPVHVVVFPTTRCQLRCPFCNYGNRGEHEDLPWPLFLETLNMLGKGGVRAIEFSGGGEPTCWPCLDEAVCAAAAQGLEVGVMTNGVDLAPLSSRGLSSCTWLRIDIKGRWQLRRLPPPPSSTFVSTSYVWHEGSQRADLEAIRQWCLDNHLACRVTFDVLGLSQEEIRRGVDLAREIGSPLHPIEPNFAPAPACYIAWFKPVLAWDGWFYACPCIGLSKDNGRALPERFRICHASQVKEFYEQQVRDLGHRCCFCKYAAHNGLLADARAEVMHENFI